MWRLGVVVAVAGCVVCRAVKEAPMCARSGVVGVGMSLVMLLRRLTGRLTGRLVGRLRAWRAEPTRAEVLTLLRRHRADLSAAPVQVLAKAEASGVSRRTLWRWLRRHGVARLELCLDAGLSDVDLRSHLSHETLPAEWALEVLAAQPDSRVG